MKLYRFKAILLISCFNWIFVDGKRAAYVCENFTCKAPVTDPKALRELLSK